MSGMLRDKPYEIFAEKLEAQGFPPYCPKCRSADRVGEWSSWSRELRQSYMKARDPKDAPLAAAGVLGHDRAETVPVSYAVTLECGDGHTASFEQFVDRGFVVPAGEA